MNCPTCHSVVADHNRFCATCGSALPAIASFTPAVVESRLPVAPSLPLPMTQSDGLSGRIIDKKYKIVGKLGSGGMGTVYRAERLQIGDLVALKLMNTAHVENQQAIDRFRREAQAAAKLKHPNAVAIYDFGESADGLFYLVMELAEGESLRQILKQQTPLAPSFLADILAQVCAALDAAHQNHIVHRDIKPDNIVVHRTANGLTVKVLDFGIAKLRDLSANDKNLTEAGSVLGTPYYMSPEQCLGEELDHRSDIYSLGVMLYEAVTGILPFNSTAPSAVVVQHVTQPPPNPRSVNPNVSPAIETVILHAMEKRREARPQNAGALAREFTAAVRGLAFNTPATTPVFAGAAPSITGATPLVPTVATVHPMTLPTYPAYTGNPQPPRATNSRTLAIILTVAVVAVIAAGVGIWWNLPKQTVSSEVSKPTTTETPGSSSTPSANSAATTPPKRPTMPPDNPSVTPNIPAANTTAAKEEVTQTLNNWVEALRDHDLNAHINYYADTLDIYHGKRNVSVNTVRADLNRAFSRYAKMDMQLSNVNISIDATGEAAQVNLQKSWNFGNYDDPKNFTGSVRQTIWLRKFGARWLITGLKDA